MKKTFSDRCDDTFRLGLNRKLRRDVARSTQKPSSPRGRGPIPSSVLCMAIRLREKDLHDALEG